jgi:dihydrofolate reductase
MAATMIFGMPQSLDGFVAAPDGEITLPTPQEALHRYFNRHMEKTAVSLYGRRMYEVMKSWDTYGDDPDANPWEIEFAKAWQRVPKVVISKTLRKVGPNATLIRSDIEAELRDLKSRTDGIIDVAGPTLAALCARYGLIDEYRLFFQPVVLGSGKRYFPEPPGPLKLLGTEKLPQQTTLLRYAPIREE